MPIYEYKCRTCNHKFDKLLLGKAQSEAIECPECSGTDVSRVFSAFGFSSGKTVRTSTNSSSACHSCTSHNCSTCGS